MTTQLTVRDQLALRDVPLDRLPSAVRWTLPERVWLDGTADQAVIRWSLDVADEPTWGDERDILNRFLKLSEGSHTQVLAFVRKYGPLRLCPHELPEGHASWCAGVTHGQRPGRTFRAPTEPVRSYRMFARLLGAVLRMLDCAKEGDRYYIDDVVCVRDFWTDLRNREAVHVRRFHRSLLERGGIGVGLEVTGDNGPVTISEALQLKRERIHIPRHGGAHALAVVNWWLELGSVHPVLTWSARRVHREDLGRGGAWSAIARQVLATAQRKAGVPHCAHCDREVQGRTRRAAFGRAVWCDRIECERARMRLTQWRSRERRRSNGKKPDGRSGRAEID